MTCVVCVLSLLLALRPKPWYEQYSICQYCSLSYFKIENRRCTGNQRQSHLGRKKCKSGTGKRGKCERKKGLTKGKKKGKQRAASQNWVKIQENCGGSLVTRKKYRDHLRRKGDMLSPQKVNICRRIHNKYRYRISIGGRPTRLSVN